MCGLLVSEVLCGVSMENPCTYAHGITSLSGLHPELRGAKCDFQK